MKKIVSIFSSAMLATSLFFNTGYAHAEAAENKDGQLLSQGFVQTDGTKFTLDGKPFYYAGTNNYYLSYKSKEEVDNVIEDAKDMGLKVIRTWGNLDVGVKTNSVNDKGYQVFTDSVDGSGEKEGVYFQYFDKDLNKPVVNEGEDGLERLDYAIYKASKENVKLLIDFTNNWEAFGGMNQYVKWAKLAGENVDNHDDFYTNDVIKGWYKNYISELLNRTNTYTGVKYKDDPTIFSWELANEPRANTDQYCKKNILADWVKEMSAYVKSIDSNHLLTVGDEGFYNYGYNDFPEGNYKYVYFGSEGCDWKQLINTPDIDFGTVHIYCDQWGLNENDAKFWLKKHGDDAREANKPVILEEYGWKDRSNRAKIYSDWFDILEGKTYDGCEYAGTNFWMLASLIHDGSQEKLYQDYDGYTVYYRSDASGNPTKDAADRIMEHAKYMSSKDGGEVVSNSKVSPTSAVFDLASPDDVKVSLTLNGNNLVKIENGTDELKAGVDYTVEDSNVTLSKEYLSKLSKGLNDISFTFDKGNKANLSISVVNSSEVEKQDATIDKTEVDVDKNDVKDVLITINTNGNVFQGVKDADGNELESGKDYALNGSQLVIKDSYLKNLKEGTTSLTFVFNEGKSPVLNIKVSEGSVTPDKPIDKEAFVRADGTAFYLNGEPFYFAGANSYDLFTLGDSWNDATVEDICSKYMDQKKIDARMQAMADNGVTVLRTWGFSSENWHGFETAPGKYVEPQFMLFDYIMKSAKDHGIKVIITLENYWEAYGGIDAKLKWAGLNGGSHTNRAQYFTNEQCKQWYKDYAKHFAERTNYFTGVKYKDDPTIFAWDLMNEPRYQDAGENETGKTLRAWVDEMAGYIKSIDPNHMVCAGLEGHGTKYNFGGDEGNPFVYIQQSPYIDFCSAHPYPDESWANLTPEQNAETVKQWIKDAHKEVGKPFVIGEFNVKKSLPADKYEAYWRSVYDTMYEENAAGALFWEFNDRQLSDFTVMDNDKILDYFKEMSDKMNKKKTTGKVRVNKVLCDTTVFDKESDPSDITVELKLAEGNTLNAIKAGESVLTEGTDYTVDGNIVTIKKEYLSAQENGNLALTFDISDDNDPTLNITIKETSILPDVAGVVKDLKAAAKTADSVKLEWSKPSEGTVSKYEVYKDGELVATTTDIKITIKDLTPDTMYKFTVRTISETGLRSDESNVVEVTTDAKGQEPEHSNVHVWKANKIYNSGSEVRHNNKLYRAKWYTCGDEPGTTGEYGVWELIEDNLSGSDDDYKDDNSWDKDSVYLAGETVEYKGHTYTAQWYTQGQEPDPSNPYGPWKIAA